MKSNNEQDLKKLKFDVMSNLRLIIIKSIDREGSLLMIKSENLEPYDDQIERLNKLIDTLERIY